MIHYIYLAWYSCVCISIRMDTDFAIIHTCKNIHVFGMYISIPINHIGNIKVFYNQNSCHHGTCKFHLWLNDLFVWPGTPYNPFQYWIPTSLWWVIDTLEFFLDLLALTPAGTRCDDYVFITSCVRLAVDWGTNWIAWARCLTTRYPFEVLCM